MGFSMVINRIFICAYSFFSRSGWTADGASERNWVAEKWCSKALRRILLLSMVFWILEILICWLSYAFMASNDICLTATVAAACDLDTRCRHTIQHLHRSRRRTVKRPHRTLFLRVYNKQLWFWYGNWQTMLFVKRLDPKSLEPTTTGGRHDKTKRHHQTRTESQSSSLIKSL